MPSLREIIEESDTRAGRTFDIVVQSLIVLSLLSFSIETIPNLSDRARRWLNMVEIVTVAIFTLEYIARIAVARKKGKYIFSIFGMVDLLAILPFYISSGIDLRSLRALRMLRLFRILKLARYNKAIRRFYHALLIAREELILYVCLTAILLYLAGTGIYYFENPAQPEAFASVFHSTWWAVETLTTVGYGDVYPITTGGQLFTFVVLMLGLGVVAVPAGLVASALSEARDREEKEAAARPTAEV